MITDDDLKFVSELQAEAWKAEKRAQKASETIRLRLMGGGRIESQNYYWDSELGMVRSRKEQTG